MPTKVYVVNRGGHNYSDAERFGKLIYLSEGNQNRFAAGAIYRTFVEVLRDSNEDDYILVTSMNVLNSIASAIFSRKHGKLNLLLFHDGKYEPRELDVDSLLHINSSNKETQDG